MKDCSIGITWGAVKNTAHWVSAQDPNSEVLGGVLESVPYRGEQAFDRLRSGGAGRTFQVDGQHFWRPEGKAGRGNTVSAPCA